MKKETKADARQRNDWHAGFEGGLKLSLRKYMASIEIERERTISIATIKIDFLVIRKKNDVCIDNAVGRGFLKHNIIEYKNPYDALTIDTLYKAIGYAGIYKSQGSEVNKISAEELTISVFRASRPLKLFKELKKSNKEILKEAPGVYRIKGIIEIPLRIIVISELQDRELVAMTIMMHNARESEVRQFLQDANEYVEQGDRSSADAVLQISASVNKALYYELWKGDEGTMNDVLREIMADDLRKAEEKGSEHRLIEQICKKIIRGKTPEVIAAEVEEPLERVIAIYDVAEKYAPEYDAELILRELSSVAVR